MNAKPEPKPGDAADCPSAAPLTNPTLSANLRAEYDALLTDVEQAHALALDFQRQLAGKSDEVAEAKRLFEKTQNDLVQLQASITALREERHRLANEAMRAMAYERQVADMTVELARTRQEMDSRSGDAERRLAEREAQIARLTLEIATLQKRRHAAESASGNPDVSSALAALWETLERLQVVLDPENTPPEPDPACEFGDILFVR